MNKKILEEFWNLYDSEGIVVALNWLESIKYYENSDNTIDNIIESFTKIKLNN